MVSNDEMTIFDIWAFASIVLYWIFFLQVLAIFNLVHFSKNEIQT